MDDLLILLEAEFVVVAEEFTVRLEELRDLVSKLPAT